MRNRSPTPACAKLPIGTGRAGSPCLRGALAMMSFDKASLERALEDAADRPPRAAIIACRCRHDAVALADGPDRLVDHFRRRLTAARICPGGFGDSGGGKPMTSDSPRFSIGIEEEYLLVDPGDPVARQSTAAGVHGPLQGAAAAAASPTSSCRARSRSAPASAPRSARRAPNCSSSGAPSPRPRASSACG